MLHPRFACMCSAYSKEQNMLVKVLVLVSALLTMVLQFELCLYAKNKVGYTTVIHQHISRNATLCFAHNHAHICIMQNSCLQLRTDELLPNYRS